MEDMLHDGIDVHGGAVELLLMLNHEPEQLLRRHVGPSARVPPERLPHVRRRLRLADLELPVEASEHLVIIVTTTHCIRYGYGFGFSLPLSLLAIAFSLLFSTKLCAHAYLYFIDHILMYNFHPFQFLSLLRSTFT